MTDQEIEEASSLPLAAKQFLIVSAVGIWPSHIETFKEFDVDQESVSALIKSELVEDPVPNLSEKGREFGVWLAAWWQLTGELS